MIQVVKLGRIGQVRLSNFSNLLKTDKYSFKILVQLLIIFSGEGFETEDEALHWALRACQYCQKYYNRRGNPRDDERHVKSKYLFLILEPSLGRC